MRKRFITTASLLCFVVLGCSQNGIRPMTRVGASLRRSAESRRLPSMGQRWLASLASRNGRERVELIDLNNDTPVPLAGINQADSQTISLSVSGDGQRIALVRQREERTELMLYRRTASALQRLPINPPGVPRSVSLNGNGRLLAVQVSRKGRWDVDLIRLP
jgi:Tol biopolymer transport system component